MDGRRRVSVILVNSRAEEEELTVACVSSLRAGTRSPDQIVLVDNGSPPEVGRRLSEGLTDVDVIHTGSNLGFTGGNNAGMERALGDGADWVWVLNNDTEVEPDCLQRLLDVGEDHPGAGCVGGKILHFAEPERIWFGGGDFSVARGLGRHRSAGERDQRDRTGERKAVEEVSFLTGCSMLLRADALRQVGLFEEDFFIYVEDADLCWRLQEAGWRLLYDPGARLYHKVPWPEPEPAPHKIVLRDRNRRRLARRRFGAWKRLRFALFFYPSRAIRFAGYLLRGDRERSRAIVHGSLER